MHYKCIVFVILIFNSVKSDDIQAKNNYLNVLANLKKFYENFNSLQFIEYLDLKNFDNVLKYEKSQYNDEQCLLQMEYFINQLNATEYWALNMFDSFGKLPSGIFSGNTYEFGNFDQCLKVSQNSKETNVGVINGQYCMLSFRFEYSNTKEINSFDNIEETDFNHSAIVMPVPNNKLSLGIGICIPNTCSPNLVNNLLNLTLSSYDIRTEIDEVCSSNDLIEFKALDIFAIVCFSIILALLFSSTIYDFITTFLNKPRIPIFLAFSCITNGRKILSCENSKSPDVIHCLNGIRVISIVWVIFGHSYLTFLYGKTINLINLFDWIQTYFSMLLLSATVSVDTFLLISGLLVTWTLLKELKKRGRINIPLIFLHRYLRLTPPLAALLLYSITLLKFSGSGPIFKSSSKLMFSQCDKWWWSLLLYVQNYVNPDEICLGHSWYLSVDMQLFWISPIIIYPLWKFGKKFIGLLPVLIMLAMACSFTTFYLNDFVLNADKIFDRMRLLYYPTHIRMHVWFVGAILGYILFVLNGKQIHLPKYITAVFWMISLSTVLAVIFGQKNIIDPNKSPKLLDNAFYESFSRVAWAVAISWIIFACAKGYGGFINTFLSSPYWLPFARLSYCLYLTHMVIQMLHSASSRTNNYFSDINAFFSFWSYFGVSLSISFIWCLAFESPTVILEKYFIRKSTDNITKRDVINSNAPVNVESTK